MGSMLTSFGEFNGGGGFQPVLRGTHVALGSLSKDDDNGSDDVRKQ